MTLEMILKNINSISSDEAIQILSNILYKYNKIDYCNYTDEHFLQDLRNIYVEKVMQPELLQKTAI